MATLTLDSLGAYGAPINLVLQEGAEDPPILIGDFSRAQAGNERTSVRAEKQVWPVVTSYVDTATKAAIKALIKFRHQITCSGDLLNNVATLCAVGYGGARVVTGTMLWEIRLTVTEV